MISARFVVILMLVLVAVTRTSAKDCLKVCQKYCKTPDLDMKQFKVFCNRDKVGTYWKFDDDEDYEKENLCIWIRELNKPVGFDGLVPNAYDKIKKMADSYKERKSQPPIEHFRVTY